MLSIRHRPAHPRRLLFITILGAAPSARTDSGNYFILWVAAGFVLSRVVSVGFINNVLQIIQVDPMICNINLNILYRASRIKKHSY